MCCRTFCLGVKPSPAATLALTLTLNLSYSSPRYGQHLDIDGIARIVQAPESEITAVASWLELNKIEYKVSKTRHVVEAEAAVAAVEALLNCELFLFKHKDEPARTLVRKVGPMYLPHQVARVVRAVFNVVGKSRAAACVARTVLPKPFFALQTRRCPARAACLPHLRLSETSKKGSLQSQVFYRTCPWQRSGSWFQCAASPSIPYRSMSRRQQRLCRQEHRSAVAGLNFPDFMHQIYALLRCLNKENMEVAIVASNLIPTCILTRVPFVSGRQLQNTHGEHHHHAVCVDELPIVHQ